MKIKAAVVIVIINALLIARMMAASEDTNQWMLWYQQPATQWVEALPIGNGHISAMIFGGVNQERLQLNEGTLWAGGPYDPVNQQAKAALPEVRQLINAGQYREASRLVRSRVLSRPVGQMPYQTVGSLRLSFSSTTNLQDYRRNLDINTAMATVSYTSDGVHYRREFFADAPDNVIVMRLTADRPGAISFAAGMDTPMKATVTVEGDDTLVMSGMGGDAGGIKGQLKYQARVKLITKGGRIESGTGTVSVTNADEAILLIAAATSYKNFQDVSGNPERVVKKLIASAAGKSYARLRTAQLKDYKALFNRVTFNLGQTDSMKLPTDERIQHFAEGNDPQFAALYYQFGRYLLISCSRPGGQPAGLQGLWNESRNPPWGSKYTININTEMNYWPAESGNLAECVEPLIAMVKDLIVTGARTAKEMYGARGWVVHHNTDLWRASGPIDIPDSGMWPSGGAGRWNSIGPVDSVVMDTNHPFVGDHTPMIKLAGNEPRGIRQTGVNFMEGATYNGRIQLAAGVEVTMKTIPGTGHEDPEFHSAENQRLVEEFFARQLKPAQ